MGEIINLRLARKAKTRAAAASTAAANRAAHGRTRAERAADAAERARVDATLRGARIAPDAPE